MGEIQAVAILPNAVLSIVMTKSAPQAPRNTTNYEYLVAMIMAKKKVLSPTSHTRIVKKDVVKPALREGALLTVSSAKLAI